MGAKVLLLSFVVLFSCCVSKNEPRSGAVSREEEILERILKSYYAVMSARDWRKYRTYFWDQATITTAWQQPADSAAGVHVISIDEFIRRAPEGPDSQPVFSEKMTDASIEVRNNLATAWVDYDAEFGTSESLMVWSGTDVFTFLRHEGDWKIVSLVFESKR